MCNCSCQRPSHAPSISNLKINFQKSEAMNILLPSRVLNLIRPNFPFKWVESHVQCLGIKIPRDLTEVFSTSTDFYPVEVQ